MPGVKASESSYHRNEAGNQRRRRVKSVGYGSDDHGRNGFLDSHYATRSDAGPKRTSGQSFGESGGGAGTSPPLNDRSGPCRVAALTVWEAYPISQKERSPRSKETGRLAPRVVVLTCRPRRSSNPAGDHSGGVVTPR